MRTEKAIKEIAELEAKLHENEVAREKVRVLNPKTQVERVGQRAELRRFDAAYTRIDERLDDIKELGIASRERAALIRELYGTEFKAGKLERSLGMRDFVYEGESKVLGRKVRVEGYRLTANVRGMGKAGQVTLTKVEEIQ